MVSVVLMVAAAAVVVEYAGGMALSEHPPAFWKKAETARWITDNIDIGALSTISVHLNGTAFGNPYAFAAAPCAAENVAAGKLFFYGTKIDTSFQDLAVNSKASFTLSLQMYKGVDKGLQQMRDFCSEHKFLYGGDPEDPRCTRLTISGTVRAAKGSEITVGKNALFSKHPAMKNYPIGHEFFVSTLDIDNVWMIDMFGGATILTKEMYYGAQCSSKLAAVAMPRQATEEVPMPKVALPPWPVNQTVHTARWLAHNADYGVLSTSSVRLPGSPFGNPQSIVDGPKDSSTGRIFLYVSDLDASMKDIAADPSCSLSLSEAWLDGQGGSVAPSCLEQGIDAEDPTCTRLVFSGKVIEIVAGTEDYKFAHSALFSRHPSMKPWPADHSWKIVELVVADIWMVNYYGGAKSIEPKAYYAYKL